jgi:hypothetical protein
LARRQCRARGSTLARWTRCRTQCLDRLRVVRCHLANTSRQGGTHERECGCGCSGSGGIVIHQWLCCAKRNRSKGRRPQCKSHHGSELIEYGKACWPQASAGSMHCLDPRLRCTARDARNARTIVLSSHLPPSKVFLDRVTRPSVNRPAGCRIRDNHRDPISCVPVGVRKYVERIQLQGRGEKRGSLNCKGCR